MSEHRMWCLDASRPLVERWAAGRLQHVAVAKEGDRVIHRRARGWLSGLTEFGAGPQYDLPQPESISEVLWCRCSSPANLAPCHYPDYVMA